MGWHAEVFVALRSTGMICPKTGLLGVRGGDFARPQSRGIRTTHTASALARYAGGYGIDRPRAMFGERRRNENAVF